MPLLRPTLGLFPRMIPGAHRGCLTKGQLLVFPVSATQGHAMALTMRLWLARAQGQAPYQWGVKAQCAAS